MQHGRQVFDYFSMGELIELIKQNDSQNRQSSKRKIITGRFG
jgi:hypothetical protein